MLKRLYHGFLIGGVVVVVGLLIPGELWACPICDLGGYETALFIVSLFGLVAVAMLILFVAFVRSGGFRESAAGRVLEVEGLNEDYRVGERKLP